MLSLKKTNKNKFFKCLNSCKYEGFGECGRHFQKQAKVFKLCNQCAFM